MDIEALTPMLRTWDLAGSIDFYRRVLGFECAAHEPELGWASMTCGPATVMLSGPNQHEGDRAPAFTGSIYFRVRDVDAVWARLRDQARVCYPIETFSYGMREFAVYDNNGYLLQFGQPVAEPSPGARPRDVESVKGPRANPDLLGDNRNLNP